MLDPFHVVKLGLACVDDVRRRRDRLSVKARARLEAGLIAGNPDGEVVLAWTVAQDLMDFYWLDNADLARSRAE